MQKVKVSIITTFYNAERFIEGAINSIRCQICPDNNFEIEYILVDDHSQDKTRSIIEEFINKNGTNGEWKIVKPEKNLGCGGARRFGIQNATGDLFMFLDADDYYINNDFVHRAVLDLQKNNADIVEYGIIYNLPNGSQTNSTAQHTIVIDNSNIAEIALFKDNLIKFNVWSKIYKRWIVESFEYSDERTFEDVRTIPVWVWNAKRVVIMPTPEINYRAASDSIIRKDWDKTRLGTITAIASHFERFKNDKRILKAMYTRSMVDLEAVLNNNSSENPGFNEMSKLNTYMLKYIYPDNWQNITYEV